MYVACYGKHYGKEAEVTGQQQTLQVMAPDAACSGLDVEVRAMTGAELAGLRDSAMADLVRAEESRRAAMDRARSRRRADPVAREWRDMAYAQFMAAEAEANGYLLNSAGVAKGIDPWALWSGPMWMAERYASWELLRFWECNPRVTVGDYRKQVLGDREAETSDYLDRDDARRVRPLASEGQESASGDCDRGRDVVPAVAAGGSRYGSTSARAYGGRDSAVLTVRSVDDIRASVTARQAVVSAMLGRIGR